MDKPTSPLIEDEKILTLSKNYLHEVRMSHSTLTSKGQITIPKTIRDALRLQTGDRVNFRLRDDGVVEMLPETGDLNSLFGILKPPKGKKVTIEGMERAIRRRASRQ